jgi:hypothetical protein
MRTEQTVEAILAATLATTYAEMKRADANEYGRSASSSAASSAASSAPSSAASGSTEGSTGDSAGAGTLGGGATGSGTAPAPAEDGGAASEGHEAKWHGGGDCVECPICMEEYEDESEVSKTMMATHTHARPLPHMRLACVLALSFTAELIQS